ncbi:unnamed protein product [Peniophora sp. CBMAI 1063]|nr:unnamed protein product [Peniophora sp. CBMAI 1063]
MFSTAILLVTAAVASSVLANPVSDSMRRQASGFITGGQATFYYQEGGFGSCGQQNSDSALIAALSAADIAPGGGDCGRRIEIVNTANGKSVVAAVEDTCPGCPSHSLDLSVATFDAIGDESSGIIPIEYKFLD